MLELLPPSPVDPLWAVAAEIEADPRPERLNLVLGVYRDETGVTPVMSAVRDAERLLAERCASKEYRGLSGNPAFNRAMTAMVLGDRSPWERTTAIQTVAGTGALRLLADLVRRTRPGATVWISDPAYVNHRPILEAAGLAVRTYGHLRHLGADGEVDTDAVLRDLDPAGPGDVVLLQGCCHNPSGHDLPAAAWPRLAEHAARNGWIPFVDVAYHGLGDGLDADLEGTRVLAAALPELLIAVSCSKNFGLYSDRTGCAIVVAPTPDAAHRAETALQNLARTVYSMPPEHGAAVVAAVLDDPRLRADWHTELDAMRERITAVRAALVGRLDALGHDATARRLATQRGMFSMLPLTADQMLDLRTRFAVYGTTAGRINIAGLAAHEVPHLAHGIAAVLDRS
ncbi:amino acid aminotransferase [Kitasatospora sp. NPDC054939]